MRDRYFISPRGGEEIVVKGPEIIAELMAVSAKTTLKGFGVDYLDIQVISEGKIRLLVKAMRNYHEETGRPGFLQDAISLSSILWSC